ncbi:MAG: Nramp family divalent metal transporter [Pirellulaceae bacterium]
MATDTPPLSGKRKWYQAVGPGIITACVVIGPGSILSSSKVGADTGYSQLWVIAIACICMMAFMTMGARLGVVLEDTPGDTITRLTGRWLAISIGIGAFMISAAYQFGNNLGVQSAFSALDVDKNVTYYLLIGFNALSISFLYLFKNMYKALEKLMMCFVGLMLISFAYNLITVKPDLRDLFSGFVPGKPNFDDLSIFALIGTTFVVTAAYFQAYLARQKGWKEDDLKDGLIDARVGSVIMFLITIMLICTAAAAGLIGKDLKSVEDVARGLEPTFGKSARVIFCLGLFAAAYSSFLVNSMIAGFILSDGLGKGANAEDAMPKALTTAVLLVGMIVAIASQGLQYSTVELIIIAQAVTVLASPIIGGVLLWLTNRRDVMKDKVNGPITNALGVIGLLILLCISYDLIDRKLPAQLDKLKVKPAQVEEPLADPESIDTNQTTDTKVDSK